LSKFQAPKGVSEYFPPNSEQFEFVRDQLINSAKLAGYSLIELPVFEDTEVFTRGVGESTDVVSKEMYTFEDRGGRSLTLRPEGTAGVMRAVIEHNLDRGQLPVNFFTLELFFALNGHKLVAIASFIKLELKQLAITTQRLMSK
jgi:histidyl-tRNA synthetase